MVMDLYTCILPIHEDPSYILEKWLHENGMAARVHDLGVFDHLETALYALDFMSRFDARDLKIDDCFVVLRMSKNSLKRRPVQLVRWICTGESKHGCFDGRFELLRGLRTHAVDEEPSGGMQEQLQSWAPLVFSR